MPVPPGFVLTTDNFIEYLECYESASDCLGAVKTGVFVILFVPVSELC